MFGSKMYSLNLGLMILALAGVLVGAAGFYAGFSGPSNTPSIILGDTNIIRIDNADTPDSTPRDGSPDSNGEPHDPDQPVDVGGDRDNYPGNTHINVEPEIEGDGKITGKVFNYEGRPVKGAKVYARFDDGSYIDESSLDPHAYNEEIIKTLSRKAKHTYVARTRSNGSFEITGLDESKAYNLSVYETGIGMGYAYAIAANDNADIYLLDRLIPVRGKIVLDSNQNTGTFEVSAYYLDQPDEYLSESQIFHSDSGSFTMQLPREGEWAFFATVEGHFQQEKPSISVGPSGGKVTLRLTEGSTLTGTVVPGFGVTLPQVSVILYPTVLDEEHCPLGSDIYNSRDRAYVDDFREISSKASFIDYASQPSSFELSLDERYCLQERYTSTDSKGRFTFTSLAPGEYTVIASLGQESVQEIINLTVGENTLDLNIDLGAMLEVSVLDSKGRLIRHPSVYAYLVDENDIAVEYQEMIPTKVTASGTHYVGLDQGRYQFTISANGYTSINETRDVLASGSSLTFTLERPVSVIGEVTTSDGSDVSSNLYVRARDLGSENPDAWDTFISIAGQNTFIIENLTPGTKTIEIVSYDNSTGNYSVRYTTTLTLVADEKAQRFSVVLEPSCNVAISMLDESGNPVAYGYINIQKDGYAQSLYVSNGQASIELINSGTYTLTPHDANNLPAGDALDLYVRPGLNETTLYVKACDCVEITYVQPDSQAAKLGFKIGDKITYYNGQAISDINALAQLVRSIPEEESVHVSISRNGAYMSFMAHGGLLGINGQNARQ